MADKAIAEVVSLKVTLMIRRFDPEVDSEAKWVDYDIEMYGTDRVLDALHKVKWEIDGSLTFRRSCAHGVCGSDAMRINGRNRLACKTLIKDLDLSQPIYIEPIKGLPVEKDLIVDMNPFYQATKTSIPSSWPATSQNAKDFSPPRTEQGMTTQPSASCVQPAQPAAQCSGPMDSTSDRLPSSMLTASSLIQETKALR
jgi:succinate dehydrogenase/fumarate reductase iron-sulfur protein